MNSEIINLKADKTTNLSNLNYKLRLWHWANWLSMHLWSSDWEWYIGM